MKEHRQIENKHYILQLKKTSICRQLEGHCEDWRITHLRDSKWWIQNNNDYYQKLLIFKIQIKTKKRSRFYRFKCWKVFALTQTLLQLLILKLILIINSIKCISVELCGSFESWINRLRSMDPTKSCLGISGNNH